MGDYVVWRKARVSSRRRVSVADLDTRRVYRNLLLAFASLAMGAFGWSANTRLAERTR